LTLLGIFLAQPGFCAAQDALGTSAETLLVSNQAIDQAMEEWVGSGEIAGAVTAVAQSHRLLHVGAVGMARLSTDSLPAQPMLPESIFWIASMTKPVTGVCVMQLVEQGRLGLDDPIDRFLPEMQDLRNDAGEQVTVTVRQLLNHTSGMRELKEPYAPKSLAEASRQYAEAGVQFPPGTKWQYSQTGINTAARLVEVLSGKSFDTYAQEQVFEPLGMSDTGFYLSDKQANRLATSYRKDQAGKLTAAPIRILMGRSPQDRERMPAANGGLFSTAIDYARFCQMLLRGGEWDGKRLLSSESIALLRTPNTGDLTTGFTPGNAWGVGVCVVREPQGVTSRLSAGSYGHGGAYGTQAWIDPNADRAYILMVQRADFPNSDASEVRRAFQDIASEVFAKVPSR
jgi:CubicO group peptidase (beta-lactamase class C family)